MRIRVDLPRLLERFFWRAPMPGRIRCIATSTHLAGDPADDSKAFARISRRTRLRATAMPSSTRRRAQTLRWPSPDPLVDEPSPTRSIQARRRPASSTVRSSKSETTFAHAIRHTLTRGTRAQSDGRRRRDTFGSAGSGQRRRDRAHPPWRRSPRRSPRHRPPAGSAPASGFAPLLRYCGEQATV